MSTFTYSVIDAAGKSVSGRIEADSEQSVLTKLHEQRFHIVNIEEARAGAFSSARARAPKVKLQLLVIFSRQFAVMINAGIGIIKCLDILEVQTKDPVFKIVLNDVKRDVKDGLSLSDALNKHQSIFSKLYINMVRAAEIGGVLDLILDRLSSFLEKELDIRQKVKSAMMYPAIVLVFAFLIVIALFIFVLPRFKDIFSAMNVDMPPTTEFLFASSDFFCAYWYMFVIGGVALFTAFKQYERTPQGRFNIDTVKLRIPIMGETILKMSISRFTRTFGTLIASGVPMMRSLEIIGETSGNAVLALAITNARSSIREGNKISVPLAASGLFPQMVTHMIDVGEETGQLSDMLIRVSDFYDAEVDATIKGLTSLIEPILIVFMGVIVGFIAISVLSPIFKLVSSIH